MTDPMRLRHEQSRGGSLSERPRIFIGSSSEGLDVANTLQVLLDDDAEVETWTQGLFEPGGSTLQSLVNAANRFDFAILIVSPDDTTISRGAAKNATRDNVIFELGLFIGVLGRERTFMVFDRTLPPDLPTDLAGVTPVTFQPHSSGNILAALGAPSHRLRDVVRRLGRLDASDAQGSGIIDFETQQRLQQIEEQGRGLALQLESLSATLQKMDHARVVAEPKSDTGQHLVDQVSRLTGAVHRASDEVGLDQVPPNALIELGKWALSKHDWVLASRYFQGYTNQDPKNWEAFFSLGVALANIRGDRDVNIAALNAYDHALALIPNGAEVPLHSRMLSYRSAIKKRLGKYSEGIADAQLAKHLADSKFDRTDAVYNLACLYALSSDTPAAMRQLRELKELGGLDFVYPHLDDYFKSIKDNPEFAALLE